MIGIFRPFALLWKNSYPGVERYELRPQAITLLVSRDTGADLANHGADLNRGVRVRLEVMEPRGIRWLAPLTQPLALLEAGASAGLCLLVDRYRYDYGRGIIGQENSPVLLRCERRGSSTPVPNRLPEVVWRAGIDLDPVDPRDESATRWLEALVWPGEGDRLARLRGAIEVARQDPPRVLKADLRADLREIIAEVPSGVTLPASRARWLSSERVYATLTVTPQASWPLTHPSHCVISGRHLA